MTRTSTYTPREIAAIAIADRVLVRLYTQANGWVEAEVLPTQFETIADTLRRVQGDIANGIRHDIRLARACLYVAGDHPLWGRMVAAMPRLSVPLELEHQGTLASDPHYPLPTTR